MKMFRGICLAVTAMLIAATTSAEEWKLKLGVNYRTFDDVDLTSFAFSNPDASTGNGYISGYAGNPGEMVVNVLNLDLQIEAGVGVPNGDFAELHKMSFNGDSDDSVDASMGFLIAASRPLTETFDLDLSLALNTLDSSTSATATGTTERLDTSSDNGWTATGGDKAQWVDTSFTGWGPEAVPGGGYQYDATGTINYDLEVDIYTFGLGLSTAIDLGDMVDLRLSAGPTLTLGSFDVSRTESAAFTDVDKTPIYSKKMSDDGLEIIAGAYAGVSVQVMLDEQFSIEGGLRYDYAVETLKTDLADLDLSGLSGELKLVFSF